MLQWQQQPPSAGLLAARLSQKLPPSLQSEHRPPHTAAVHAMHALIEFYEYALYCKHVNTAGQTMHCKQSLWSFSVWSVDPVCYWCLFFQILKI